MNHSTLGKFHQVSMSWDKSIETIATCFDADCANGHFKPMIGQNGNRLSTSDFLGKIADLEFADLGLHQWPAQIHIYSEHGVDVGYIVETKLPPEFESLPWIELYMAGIFPEHRGSGVGKRMMQAAVQAKGTSAVLTARCLPASGHMKHILVSCGFTDFGKDKDGISMLGYGPKKPLAALENVVRDAMRAGF